jgi:hypothetical protein
LIEAKRLEKINSIVARARRAHYMLTKPWCDDGLRILPNVLHLQFANEFRVLKREFNDAADEFCHDYPGFVEERKKALGRLFRQDDYPAANDIRSKFKLETKSFPVPDADDFRSDVLDADTIEDIKRELTETSESVLDGAMADTAASITRVIGHMADKLKDYKLGKKKDRSFFNDSLVGNVRQLADLLPAFNLTNDPALDAITKRIKQELCVEEATTLRKDDDVRESVRKSADDILKDVSALLG